MTSTLTAKPASDLIFTAAVAALGRCNSRRLGPKHDALRKNLPTDRLFSSLHDARTNFWIHKSPASTSSMQQQKYTTEAARHLSEPENAKSSSGGSSAASVKVSSSTTVKLREQLDSTDQPFKVKTSALSRKGRRRGEKLQVQQGLFEERLDVQYEVQPLDVWKKLRGYKRFTGRWWPWCYSS